jgi:hypothetical protein
MSERRRWKRFLLHLAGRAGRPRCRAVVAGMDLACEIADISCGGMRLAVAIRGPAWPAPGGQRVELAPRPRRASPSWPASAAS